MTLPTQPLDQIPLGVVYILIIGLLLLATEVGFQAGRSWQHRIPEKDTAIGPMVAATLGLVAFLLAFMTSLAADRFDTRRRLVLAEANAIGTAYLRAGYLPEPYATESRDLLREYVDVRLSAVEPGNLEAAVARSEEIQVELWRRGEALVEQTGGSDVYALYLEAVNEVVELHSQREIAAFYARVPLGLLVGLFVFTILGMFILGFNNSYDGRRSAIALVSLILVFGSVLFLIMDLDRSREGLFQVSDQPLISLQERLNP
jgi:hypothetical protein